MTDRKPHQLTRRTHPDTSLQAAEQIVANLGKLQRETLERVRYWPGLTTSEMAAKYCMRDPREHGRRLPELLEAGLIESAGRKKCAVTGRKCETYRVVKPRPTGTLFDTGEKRRGHDA